MHDRPSLSSSASTRRLNPTVDSSSQPFVPIAVWPNGTLVHHGHWSIPLLTSNNSTTSPGIGVNLASASSIGAVHGVHGASPTSSNIQGLPPIHRGLDAASTGNLAHRSANPQGRGIHSPSHGQRPTINAPHCITSSSSSIETIRTRQGRESIASLRLPVTSHRRIRRHGGGVRKHLGPRLTSTPLQTIDAGLSLQLQNIRSG